MQTFVQDTNLPVDHQPVPMLPPEIWSRIFVMACRNLQKLSRIATLSKSIYLYCWHSPAAKAAFFIDHYGKRYAISKAFATKCYALPQFNEILKIMIQNGAKSSCTDKEQRCPLIYLSELDNAVECLKVFYSCKPKISDKHLRRVMEDAVYRGRLDLLYALLNEDPANFTPQQLSLQLKKKRIELNISRLLQTNQSEMVLHLVLGGQYTDYWCDALAFALKDNHMSEARILMAKYANHLEDPNEISSVWSFIGFGKVSTIESALEIGLIPSGACLLLSSGLMKDPISCFGYGKVSVLDQFDPPTLSPIAYAANDTLLKAKKNLITEKVLTTAVVFGHVEYITYLLKKWSQQDNYLEANIISVFTIHNAFMLRNWNLVELLVSTCYQWAHDSGQIYNDFTQLLAAPHSGQEPFVSRIEDNNNIWPLNSESFPYPRDAEENYFFEKVPILVKLGIYPENVYSLAIEALAEVSVLEDQFAKNAACIEKLLSLGAIVSQEALFKSTWRISKPYDEVSVRFKYLVEKFEVDPHVGFSYFPRLISKTSPGTVELLLAKGVPVTAELIKAVLYLSDTKIIRLLLNSVKPGNPLRETYVSYLESTTATDLNDRELWLTKMWSEYLLEYGFWAPQGVIDRVEASGRPRLTRFLKSISKETLEEYVQQKLSKV